MKRLQMLALGSALFLPLGLVGCAEESKVETKTKVDTPDGTATKTDTTTVEKTGDHKTNP